MMRLDPGGWMIEAQAPNWAEALTAIVGAITLFAILLAAVQISHVNRQMHRELEMQYLLRFWGLMDRRSEKFKLKGNATRADRLLVQDYLSLCEDQIGLRRLGRVTDHTWSFWRDDIRVMCSSAPIHKEICRASQESFPHLRRLLTDAEYDPLNRGRIWRLWQGL